MSCVAVRMFRSSPRYRLQTCHSDRQQGYFDQSWEQVVVGVDQQVDSGLIVLSDRGQTDRVRVYVLQYEREVQSANVLQTHGLPFGLHKRLGEE